MSTAGHGEGITYTVKEMLQKLDEKIDRIEQKLDSKVDVVLFDRIQQRVERAADQALVLALEVKVNELSAKLDLQEKVSAAVSRRSREVEQKAASNFTRREKIVGGFLGTAALAIQAYVAFKVGF